MAANEWGIEDLHSRVLRELVLEKAARERRRSLVVPREHEAWASLLVPLVTGAGVALQQIDRIFSLAMLLVAALALFWLRTPVGSLLGTLDYARSDETERMMVGVVILLLATVGIVTLGALLWAGRNPFLLLIGAAAAAAFLAQVVLRRLDRRARMLSEIVRTIGLTSSVPAAYYVITGHFGVTAWMLWLANLAFAGNQIHYVQLRIHTARL